MMSQCKNCHAEINGNFCMNCGKAAKVERIDGHYISHEIQHLLHLEKGFLYTAWEMLVRPGITAKTYIMGDRARHVKPVMFLILASLVYSLVIGLLHIENKLPQTQVPSGTLPLLFKWVQGHYGYANIIMGGFIALCLSLFFRKYKYNIFEITVLLCFVMGEGMLFLTLTTFLTRITRAGIISNIADYAFLIYVTWAIGQFFDARKAGSYIKAFLAYLLGMTGFYIVLGIVAVLWDLLLH